MSNLSAAAVYISKLVELVEVPIIKASAVANSRVKRMLIRNGSDVICVVFDVYTCT